MTRTEVLLRDRKHGIAFLKNDQGKIILACASYGKSKLIAIPLSQAEGLSLLSAAQATFVPPPHYENWLETLIRLMKGDRQ